MSSDTHALWPTHSYALSAFAHDQMPEYRALYAACTSLPVADLLSAVAQCRLPYTTPVPPPPGMPRLPCCTADCGCGDVDGCTYDGDCNSSASCGCGANCGCASCGGCSNGCNAGWCDSNNPGWDAACDRTC